MTGPAQPLPLSTRHSIDDRSADERALFRAVAGTGRLAPGNRKANTSAPEASGDHASVTVEPTAYGRGPWDHGLLHGGPVVGLAAWAAEQLAGDEPLNCARLTVELHHGVPVATLDVSATVVRSSRRSRVIDVSIRHDSTVVARATSQWLAPSSGWTSGQVDPPPRPDRADDPGAADVGYPRPGFNCDAAELRYTSGSNEVSGPAVIWARLTSPLIAGTSTSPFVCVATIADLAAAAGFERGPNDEAFINADLTLQLDRYPDGEWLALDARTHRAPGAVGHNEATVFDGRGSIGRILQSLVEAPVQPAFLAP